MPVHDWARVDAGLFHAFHQRWISAICDSLNTGVLPAEYFALPEQVAGGLIPDVLTLNLAGDVPEDGAGGVAVATAPPRTRLIQRTDADLYAKKANLITVRHRHGRVIAMIELVSPGNKSTRAAVRAFAEKTADFIQQGVHVLVVDLFPPGKRDPQRLHKVIWDQFQEEEFQLPADKPLTLASYAAGPVKSAYVEAVAVGDALPDMPLFLQGEQYVPAPLESTYQTSWQLFPAALKGLLK